MLLSLPSSPRRGIPQCVGDAIAADYGLSVGRFIREHPGWIVAAGFEGVGYRARRREGGSWLSALTLDELHVLLEAA